MTRLADMIVNARAIKKGVAEKASKAKEETKKTWDENAPEGMDLPEGKDVVVETIGFFGVTVPAYAVKGGVRVAAAGATGVSKTIDYVKTSVDQANDVEIDEAVAELEDGDDE